MLTTPSTEAATSKCTKSDCIVNRRDLEPHLNSLTFNELLCTPEQTRHLGRSGKEMRVLKARYRADHVKTLVSSCPFLSNGTIRLHLNAQRPILPECASSVIGTHPPHKVWHYWRPQNVKPHVRLCAVMTPAGVCPQSLETDLRALAYRGGGGGVLSLNVLHSQLTMESKHDKHIDRRPGEGNYQRALAMPLASILGCATFTRPP